MSALVLLAIAIVLLGLEPFVGRAGIFFRIAAIVVATVVVVIVAFGGLVR